MFKIVCAWCQKTIKEGGFKGAPVTHLICQPCYEKQMRLFEEEQTQAAHASHDQPKKPRKLTPPSASS